MRVHRDDGLIHGQAHAAHVEPDEMRRQPDHRAHAVAHRGFGVVDPDQAPHARLGPPPQQAVLEHGAHRGLKGLPQPAVAHRLGGIGKTQGEVGGDDVPALARQQRQQPAQGIADGRLQRQRQPVQQPQQADAEPDRQQRGAHQLVGLGGAHSSGGSSGCATPPGRLWRL